MQFLSFCLLAQAAWASPLAQGYGHGGWPHNGAAKAAYFLDNDPSGSSIVSLHIANDGQLSHPARTSTNGYGAIGTNLTGFPNTADSLMGQSAVVVSGDVSFSVRGQVVWQNAYSRLCCSTGQASRWLSLARSTSADCDLASFHRQCWQQHTGYVQNCA